MLKRRPVSIVALLLIIVMVVMTGCGPNSSTNNNTSSGNNKDNATASAESPAASEDNKTDEVVELTMSVIPGPVGTSLKADAEAFMAKNPNIKITLNEFPEGQYMDQGPRLFSSSEKPDMAWFWADAAYKNIANEGLLEPLDDLYESEKWNDVLPKSTIERVRAKDEHLYAVNNAIVWGPVVYYNEAAFEKAGVSAPKTMAEWYEMGPKLEAAGYIPLASGNADVGVLVLSGLMVNAFKAEDYSALLSGNAEFTYTDERVVQVFKDLKRMGDELMHKGAAGVNDPDARALFTQGKAAMYSNGSWAASDALLGKELPADFKLGNFYYPQMFDEVPAKVAIYPGNSLIVLKGTGKEEYAKQFVAFAMSKERQIALAEGKQLFPSRTDLEKADIEPMGPIYVDMYERMIAQGSDNFWHTEVSAELSTKGRELVSAVISGALTPEAAAAELQAVYEKSK